MISIIQGAIGSIIAVIIVGLATKAMLGVANIPGIKIMFRLVKDFFSSGGLNFFSNREAYTRHKDHGAADNYLTQQTKADIIYVGFYLAQSCDIGNILNCLVSLSNKGINVKVVLLDPSSPNISATSDFFMINKDHLISCVNETKNKLLKARRNSVSEDNKKNFNIYLHNKPITTSAFIIDGTMPKIGRILLDHKLYGVARENSYGIELRSGGNLYKSVFASYMKILNDSTCITGD